jgi:hypothetical protein
MNNLLFNSNPISIPCKWVSFPEGPCSKVFMDAKTLYKHISMEHVGWKAENNLCLTCQWGNCGKPAKRRDQLMSHIRVHIPLKPFTCKVSSNLSVCVWTLLPRSNSILLEMPKNL